MLCPDRFGIILDGARLFRESQVDTRICVIIRDNPIKHTRDRLLVFGAGRVVSGEANEGGRVQPPNSQASSRGFAVPGAGSAVSSSDAGSVGDV